MISIQEASTIIQARLPDRNTEIVPVDQALGRILAEDISSPEPSPRYTNSAMDGFAVRWQDVAALKERNSVRLTVVGESRAGVPFVKNVQSGQAVRISTGAMLPGGADSVIPVEDVEEKQNGITILSVCEKNQHVRFQGEEFKAGAVILQKGSHITPAALGLLAAPGIEKVLVFQRPKVAVIVTGSEVVSHSAEINPWQIRDSNGPMLSSAVQFSGGDVTAVNRCSDDLPSIRKQIRKNAELAQILIFSGGVSVGPHDLVKEAVKQEKFETLFWRVNQKPGKPLFLAKKNKVLLFGLPGNPVSALNCFAYYIHPVLQRLQGCDFKWQTISGVLSKPAANKGERNLFLRVQVNDTEKKQPQISPLIAQGSHMLTSLAQADGFILLQPQEDKLAGDSVRVFLYPWGRK